VEAIIPHIGTEMVRADHVLLAQMLFHVSLDDGALQTIAAALKAAGCH
jgi:hypothetical protein